jgi:clan AA aspartic protease
MKLGTVFPSGEAMVLLRVRGPHDTIAEAQAVVDTGFNDFLTMSRSTISELGLHLRAEGRYALADGSEVMSRLFIAEVEWFGRWRRILVVEMEGGPLLGMAMLRGFYLGVEVIDGGAVEIHPLTP